MYRSGLVPRNATWLGLVGGEAARSPHRHTFDVRRLLVPVAALALIAAAAPSSRAVDGTVTVRVVGGAFNAKGAIKDAGRATVTPTRVRLAGKKGALFLQVDGKLWHILAGTKAYKGLYGHGTIRRSTSGAVVTMTGTIERPRQPTV